jgi:hypothetical protein
VKRIVLCGLVCIGCGSSAPKTPMQKCDDLITTVCDRGVQCIPAAGTHAECVSALQPLLPCAMVKTVTASYDRCIDQLKSDSCAMLFPTDSSGHTMLTLPTDCVGVLQMFEPPGAPIGSTYDGVTWMGRTADPE